MHYAFEVTCPTLLICILYSWKNNHLTKNSPKVNVFYLIYFKQQKREKKEHTCNNGYLCKKGIDR